MVVKQSLNLMFIGNSFTARPAPDGVPGLIARLAEARGLRLEHRLISAGGASLRRHWNEGKALEAIRAGVSGARTGGYDYVVLQEQSTLPIKNPKRMHESVRLFDEAIRAAGSKTGLYLTWARLNAPAPASHTSAQQAITDAYTSIGRELGATVVPVGIAWQQFLRAHDRPVLYDKDQSHPTLAGSYLAACVFFATLFGESPVGIAVEVKGLNPDDAELLQRAAEDVVK